MDHYRESAKWLCNVDNAPGDSPIEKLFYVALTAELEIGGHNHELCRPCRNPADAGKSSTPEEIFADWPCPAPGNTWLVAQPQNQIEEFRVDFVFTCRDLNGRFRKLVVECDGHDFHERTKEQAAKDRARDRRLQELGYTVFRFTGSEIWRDPLSCAQQVVRWASNDPDWAGK